MGNKFRNGDRVKISAAGLARLPWYRKNPARIGTIVDLEPEYPNTVRVRWDGVRTADDLSEAFVELERNGH